MSQTEIQAQVEAIKKVTTEALKTEEAALKFLRDAGIITTDQKSHKQNKALKKD
jgi:phosphoribosylaminoimidazole-succinocarboxamide synthase